MIAALPAKGCQAKLNLFSITGLLRWVTCENISLLPALFRCGKDVETVATALSAGQPNDERPVGG